jgi:hypothetical protein
VEWAQAATIIGANTAVLGIVVGLQTFWISRALDALRGEMRRDFDRVEARLDRLERREPPTLRRV